MACMHVQHRREASRRTSVLLRGHSMASKCWCRQVGPKGVHLEKDNVFHSKAYSGGGSQNPSSSGPASSPTQSSYGSQDNGYGSTTGAASSSAASSAGEMMCLMHLMCSCCACRGRTKSSAPLQEMKVQHQHMRSGGLRIRAAMQCRDNYRVRFAGQCGSPLASACSVQLRYSTQPRCVWSCGGSRGTRAGPRCQLLRRHLCVGPACSPQQWAIGIWEPVPSLIPCCSHICVQHSSPSACQLW